MAGLPQDYQDLSASQKRDALWASIQSSTYPSGAALPAQGPGAAAELQLLWPPYLWATFLHSSDALPRGRVKLIHTFGSVCKVSLKINPASRQAFGGPPGYSGIFKSGGAGLLRLSPAKQNFGSFQPGAGLKILISGRPSVNFLIMPTLDGQGNDFNAFRHPYTNVLAPPQDARLRVVAASFAVAVPTLSANAAHRPEDARHLPMLEAAQVQADGTEVPIADVRAPYQIILQPTPEITAAYHVVMQEDMRLSLAQIAAGSLLFEVQVRESATAELESIGSIVMESEFLASGFGDEVLFFQHMRHRVLGGAQ
ncbi:hypothetical protein COCSUDRAFT_58584 [Coccomyxa subellipsoidea C-169]|uniref:Uncharacterized protein n=1 Tax=Coccomyxa subellipsoidea (strain C-169) TaxID=574566 RepID=I0YLL8_COCSC|nr:hypothetical protein COCSUDRAFT_58584 [Coccomyxa subellipsoidea C-169]EIE19287.1 hypothetical protein COCSUDRAFT_58584 [Coccomyxa subellipsoidea C-169]|eukprot:XP_005643831.1 hypothetical protein COCSUDRAFT_58584 [Coccomyxa subellipsoidea C-169]